MTDNTPLNADDELRRHCDSLGVPSLWYDKLIDIVLADSKKHELQARIDALEYAKISPKFKIEERVEALKQELESL